MNLRKKVELVSKILDRYDEGSCLYCGTTLNGDLEDFDEFYSDDWCPDCCENIDPDDNWEDACLKAIDKVIHDEKFKPL
ncbi:MAG: hypothetical protein ACXABO_02325 [Promethearchaeota archaeon]|jgi:hypothetical protein